MKLKKIKRMVAVGTAILMTLSLAGCGIGSDSVKLGAAGVGGGYYAFSNAFAQIASSEDEDLDFEVKATAGSTANIRLLSDGYVDMAIAQADLVDAATTEQAPRTRRGTEGTRQLPACTLRRVRSW